LEQGVAHGHEHSVSRATLLKTTSFEDLWSEALVDEQIVDHCLADRQHAEHAPIAVLQLLLVQTGKPIAAN
jgi:hypothetical protein